MPYARLKSGRDAVADVRVFGVRHHGPGSARSLVRALEEFDPDAVVIEAPADAEGLVRWVPKLTPPVAVLAWNTAEPARAAWWPFAAFSPEWQALVWAHRHTVDVSFMDLPAATVLADPSERESWRDDPLSLLAEAAGYDDPERWWEDLVEQRDAQPFEVVAEVMAAVRETGADDDETLRREAHMRKVIRAASRGRDRVAVVCGAYHAPALSGKTPTVTADNALLKGLPKVAVTSTWVPWSHGRLASWSGYGAGITSPGWYDHLFTAPDRPVERWLTKVGGVLRGADLPTSSAHVIEGVRLAEALAVLRGRPMPGLSEVQEATLAVLCEGSDTALELVTREAVEGERLGEVPDEVPRTPLDADMHATARRLRLKQEATAKELSLDLRKDNDLAKSQLLRRLLLLGVAWGTPSEGWGTGTFREVWALEWRPELSVAVIDASRWGTTVVAAASARLLDGVDTLAEVTRAVENALLADLPDALAALLPKLDERAAHEADIAHLLDALPPLVRSHRYGDVRGTDTGQLGSVIDAVLARACAGLGVALAGLAPDAATQMRDRLDAAHAVVGMLDDAAQAMWRDTLMRALDRGDLPGLIAGRLTRMLFDAGQLDADEVSSRLSLALSGGHPAVEQAAWAEGLLTGSSLLLLHNPALLRVIDAWVLGLSDEGFVEVLPVLRRAFGAWGRPERRSLATKVLNLEAPPTSSAAATVDLSAYDGVLDTVAMLLGVTR